MPNIDITPQKFEELIKRGYSLDIVCLLELIEVGFYEYWHPKIISLEQTCKRKGLLSEDGKVTEDGKALLVFISSSEEISKLISRKKVDKIEGDEPFIKWWKSYPITDTFKYKGKEFTGTRALRVRKGDCEIKVNKILASGEYKIEELIAALKLEISQKAENSIKTGQNKMSYFQNSLTYLNQATYDPYVELVRAGHKPKEETKTVSNETFI